MPTPEEEVDAITQQVIERRRRRKVVQGDVIDVGGPTSPARAFGGVRPADPEGALDDLIGTRARNLETRGDETGGGGGGFIGTARRGARGLVQAASLGLSEQAPSLDPTSRSLGELIAPTPEEADRFTAAEAADEARRRAEERFPPPKEVGPQPSLWDSTILAFEKKGPRIDERGVSKVDLERARREDPSVTEGDLVLARQGLKNAKGDMGAEGAVFYFLRALNWTIAPVISSNERVPVPNPVATAQGLGFFGGPEQARATASLQEEGARNLETLISAVPATAFGMVGGLFGAEGPPEGFLSDRQQAVEEGLAVPFEDLAVATAEQIASLKEKWQAGEISALEAFGRAMRAQPSVGEIVFGVDPDQALRIQRADLDDPALSLSERVQGQFANWWQGTIERVEEGRSWTTDLGETYGASGTRAGLLLDVLMPTGLEFIDPLKVVNEGVKAAKVAGDAMALGPAFNDLGTALRAGLASVRNTTPDFADWGTRNLVASLVAGDMPANAIGPGLREIMQEVVSLNVPGFDSLDDLIQDSRNFFPSDGPPRPDVAKEMAKRAKKPSVERVAEMAGVRAEDMTEAMKVAKFKHEGFQVMKHLDPGQNPNTARYVVIDADGVTTVTGATLREAAEAMATRAHLGDEIWFAGHRRVAAWTQARRLRASPVFSSLEEFDTITKLSPRKAFRPDKLKVLDKATVEIAGAKMKAQGVHRAIFDLFSGRPAHRSLVELGGSAKILADVIHDSMRIWARERTGAHKLRALPTGAPVHPVEWRNITREARGLMAKGIEEGDVGQALSPEKMEKFVEFARQFGIHLGEEVADGVVDAATHRRVYNTIIEKRHAVAAQTRYGIQGTKRFTERLLAEIFVAPGQDVAQIGAKLPKVLKTLRRAQVKVGRSFVDPLSLSVSPQVQRAMLEARRRLARVGDEMADRVRELALKMQETGEVDAPTILKTIIGDYTPRRRGEVDLADEVMALTGEGITATQLGQLLARVRTHIKGERPEWIDHADVAEQLAGLQVWALDVYQDMRDYAQATLAVYSGGSGGDAAGAGASRLRTLYRELFVEGVFDGPALKEAADAASLRLRLANEEGVMSVAIALRSEHEMREVTARLLEEGVGFLATDPNKGVARVVKRMIEHGEGSLQRPDGTWVYELTEAEVVAGRQYLRRLGIVPGMSGPPKKGVLQSLGTSADGRVLVPTALMEDLQALKKAGLLSSRALLEKEGGQKVRAGLDRALSLYKQLALGTLIVPRPRYFFGQTFGLVPTLITTRGYQGLHQSMQAAIDHADLVGELMKQTTKLSNQARSTPRASLVLKTSTGLLYTSDELVEMIRRFGLDESFARVEGAVTAQEMLTRLSRPYDNIGLQAFSAAGRWSELLKESASIPDQVGRLGTFIAELKLGKTPAEAAEAARAALYDFTDLTNFERTVGRFVFTFYSFLRKNADAHILALLRHPDRVARQARFTFNSVRGMGQTWEDFQGFDQGKLTQFPIYSTDKIYDASGNPHPHYRGWSAWSPAVGATEWIISMQDLGKPIQAAVDGDPVRGLSGAGSQVNPSINILAEAITGSAIGGTHKRSDRAAIVPSALLQHPMIGTTLGQALDVRPVPLANIDPEADPRLESDPYASRVLGVPAVYVAFNRTEWSLFTRAMSPVIAQIRALFPVWSDQFRDSRTDYLATLEDVGLPADATGMQALLLYTFGVRALEDKKSSTILEEQRREREREIRDELEEERLLTID